MTDIRVVQPEPYFDPRLPDRAAMAGRARGERRGASCGGAGSRSGRRRTTTGATFLYGDRHQYTKLATLFTHTGLVLFLVAAAVTSRLGEEQGLVVPEGESLTVQPIGTPGLLLVKNLDFEAPGLDTGSAVATSRPISRSTATARRSRARRSGSTTRSRSPATPSTRTGSGRRRTSSSATPTGKPLWDGAVPLTDAAADCAVRDPVGPGPGPRAPAPAEPRPATDAATVLILPYRVTGTDAADGTRRSSTSCRSRRSSATRSAPRTRASPSSCARSGRTRCSSPSRTPARGSSGSRS